MISKKEKAIEDLIPLFKDKGFNSTSINDISITTGIVKGSLYTYFKNKEEIILLVMDTMEEIFLNYIDSPNFIITMNKTANFFLVEKSCLMGTMLSESLPILVFNRVKEFFYKWQSLLEKLIPDFINIEIKNKYLKFVISSIEGAVLMMKINNDSSILNNCIDKLIDEYNLLINQYSNL